MTSLGSAEPRDATRRPPPTRQYGMAIPAKVVLGIALIGAAMGAGFAAGMGAIALLSAVLPPFRPEDDETLRELVPAALAYGAWAATTLLVIVLGWRRLRSRKWRQKSPRSPPPAGLGVDRVLAIRA